MLSPSIACHEGHESWHIFVSFCFCRFIHRFLQARKDLSKAFSDLLCCHKEASEFANLVGLLLRFWDVLGLLHSAFDLHMLSGR